MGGKSQFGFLIFLIILGTIIVGLAYYGYGILTESRNLEEYLSNPPNYLFNFGVTALDYDSIIYLNSAKFDYDMTNKKAFIAFDPNNVTIDEIFLQLPEIDNNTIKCYSAEDIGFYKESDSDYISLACNSENKIQMPHEGYNESAVRIYLKNNTSKNKRIKIEFDLKLEHSFAFEFIKNKQNVWYADPEGSIIIHLGKDYECFQDCIYNLRGFSPVYLDNPSKDRRLILNLSAPQNDFKIITRSIKNADDKTEGISLGVAVLVGALFGIISWLIEVFRWIFSYISEKGKKIRIYKKMTL
jgi:hypothetical protein